VHVASVAGIELEPRLHRIPGVGLQAGTHAEVAICG
jgi:hypothetical protein